jgi:hypothetical protein
MRPQVARVSWMSQRDATLDKPHFARLVLDDGTSQQSPLLFVFAIVISQLTVVALCLLLTH